MKRMVYVGLLVLMACSNPSTLNPNPNPNELSVNISSPSGAVYTNGSINIQVVVGGTPDTIELLKNNQVLVGNLTAPYSYTWDTKSEAEGVYELIARASAGGKTVDSEIGTSDPLNFINTNRAFDPSLQLGSEGNPFLTWQEAFTNGSFTALKYFRENTWKVLVSDGKTTYSYAPSLALDASGDPVVAWAAGSSAADTDLYVKRKNPGKINN